MTDKPDGKRWVWRPWIGVASLALYVLSAGPASYLESHELISERAIPFLRWFYLPVVPLTYFETWRRYLNWFIWR
jgi:hypothetical protein